MRAIISISSFAAERNLLRAMLSISPESKTSPNYNQVLEQYRNDADKYKDIESIDYNVIETTMIGCHGHLGTIERARAIHKEHFVALLKS